MYGKARLEGNPEPDEAEFRAYHLLHVMGCHSGYKYISTEHRKALKECEPVKDHPYMRLAVRLQSLLNANNWVSYFEETVGAPYILACAAALYFPNLRAHCLNSLKDSRRGGTKR